MGKVMIIILASFGFLYAAVLGGLFFWQRHVIFPGAFQGALAPSATLPASLSATSVITADGVLLRALWKAPRPGCGVVVSFHGNASFPEDAAGRFTAGPWGRDGWGLLAIAYRGYPGSGGVPSEAGLIQDGLAAYAEVERRAPRSPILLHGHSLGAAVAIAVAERDSGYAGLYLEAPFASVLALAQARLPFVPVSLLLRDPFRSDLRIGNLHGPIAIVHGTDDGVVPVSEGRRLAASGRPGTLFEAIAGDHVSILGARDPRLEPLFQKAIGGCPTA